MAAPVTARFGKFLVRLSDGGSPEQFVAPCGFTSKSLTLTKNLSEVSIPDCDDPDAPISIGRDVESVSASISGEGVLAAEAVERWKEAFESTDSVPVEIEVTFSTGVLLYTGLFHLASLAYSAEQGGRVTISVEMQSDGEITGTWTPA